jgi:hypothetical protein
MTGTRASRTSGACSVRRCTEADRGSPRDARHLGRPPRRNQAVHVPDTTRSRNLRPRDRAKRARRIRVERPRRLCPCDRDVRPRVALAERRYLAPHPGWGKRRQNDATMPPPSRIEEPRWTVPQAARKMCLRVSEESPFPGSLALVGIRAAPVLLTPFRGRFATTFVARAGSVQRSASITRLRASGAGRPVPSMCAAKQGQGTTRVAPVDVDPGWGRFARVTRVTLVQWR